MSTQDFSAERIAGAVDSVVQQGLSLALSTSDLCFLVALHLRSTTSQLSSFAEHQLEDVFGHVRDLTTAGDEPLAKSATRAIARLREQRMLSRVDGLGVVRAPEYSLTRLATAIIENLLEEEILTRESLSVLTRSLAIALRDVKSNCEEAESDGDWAEMVIAPLRVSTSDLVRGIERRQRGLDQQQEAFQETIRGLLDADWFGSIDRCQELLDTTSLTLRELNELLLRDSQQLLASLQGILERALSASQEDAASIAHQLIDKLDRIVAWGSARQSAWSEYFQYVHRFLRDVVRLDPSRALTQRLREQLAGTAGRSFALAVAGGESIVLLREAVARPDAPPVSRPRKPRDTPPKQGPVFDADAALREQVRERVEAGAQSLAEVTTDLAAELEGGDQFACAGRVAQSVAEVGKPRPARPRPWVKVGDDLLIEDWNLSCEDQTTGVAS
ncbi:MAG: condensin subunit MukF [Myxococcales bacterium]|nr:condensin subunit MukF [Myxococcales bacterium]